MIGRAITQRDLAGQQVAAAQSRLQRTRQVHGQGRPQTPHNVQGAKQHGQQPTMLPAQGFNAGMAKYQFSTGLKPAVALRGEGGGFQNTMLSNGRAVFKSGVRDTGIHGLNWF